MGALLTIRQIDNLGRIAVPVLMRRELGMQEGERVQVLVEGQDIILRKAAQSCIFCGSQEAGLLELGSVRSAAAVWKPAGAGRRTVG